MNDIISNYVDEGDDSLYIDPVKGNCAFGSGYFGWAVTITGMAQRLAAEFSVTEEQMAKILWGESFFHASEKKFSSSPRDTDKN